MSTTPPPRFALYLLLRFAAPYQREALVGDLIEQLHSGRSTRWFWRQALSAIFVARLRELESKQWRSITKTALRVINAIMLAAALALGVGTFTRADSPQQTCPRQAQC